MKSPIQYAIDRVKMTRYHRTEPFTPKKDELYATHEGIFDLGAGIQIRCYQLNDGRRVLDAEDLHKFLGIPLTNAE